MKKKNFLPLEKREYLEYAYKLSKDELEFISQVYQDLYSGGLYDGSSVLSEDVKKEANKNQNSLNRDAMSVSERNGDLSYYHENMTTEEMCDLLECVADETEWQIEYDRFGFKAAAKLIFDQTEKDLQNKLLNVKVVLNRFLEKMTALKRLRWRDRKRKK